MGLTNRVFTRCNVKYAAAGNRTVCTGVLSGLILNDGIAVRNLIQIGKCLSPGQGPIFYRSCTAGNQRFGKPTGSVFHQRLGHAGHVAHFLNKILTQAIKRIFVGNGGPSGSAHRHGFKHFGAHHRPHA